MSEDKTITFQDSVDWATTESKRKETRSKGIPSFYLVIGAVTIFTLVIFIIYLMGRNPDEEMDALEMMKNDKYLFEGDDSYESFLEGDSVYEDDDYIEEIVYDE